MYRIEKIYVLTLDQIGLSDEILSNNRIKLENHFRNNKKKYDFNVHFAELNYDKTKYWNDLEPIKEYERNPKESAVTLFMLQADQLKQRNLDAMYELVKRRPKTTTFLVLEKDIFSHFVDVNMKYDDDEISTLNYKYIQKTIDRKTPKMLRTFYKKYALYSGYFIQTGFLENPLNKKKYNEYFKVFDDLQCRYGRKQFQIHINETNGEQDIVSDFVKIATKIIQKNNPIDETPMFHKLLSDID